jgi:hypothetical protein
MEQEYLILNNGSYSYKVFIKNDNQVKIYKIDETKDDKLGPLILSTDISKVFVGKSPFIPMTDFSGAYGPNFDGNTLLLQKSEYSYIWVGEKIISFLSYFPIVEYISPVGNNQVPYPWAIDEKGWVYLFLTSTVITNIPSTNLSDPYNYFWFNGLGLICGPNNITSTSTTLIENFQSITKFFIGDEEYRLIYSAHPDQEFDRLVDTFNSEIYIEKTDGIKYKLDKPSFIKLMKDFGEDAGLCVLDHMVLID